MFTFIVIIHVTVCIFLIVAILMQSGRGGGLSEAFGGGSGRMGGTMGSLFGTESTNIMTKITIGLAIVFFITSLFITIIGRRQGISLMEKADIQEKEEKAKGEKKEKKGQKEKEPGIPLGPRQQGMPLK